MSGKEEELRKQLDITWLWLTHHQHEESVQRSLDESVRLMTSYGDTRELEGMQKAKSRVLRRTEIPKDAKNPTRDATVLLGEAIADIIDGDIANLKEAKRKTTDESTR